MAVCILNGCATLKDSLILGAGTGAAVGAAAGATIPGDRGEGALFGAVLGGVIGGVASYFIHNSLQDRDERVRRDTLMNLEHYEVLGVSSSNEKSISSSNRKCMTTRLVDNRLVSIPCDLAPDTTEGAN